MTTTFLFDQILSLVPCAVFWKDTNGKFKGCNDAFLTFSGLSSKAQLLDKTDQELPWCDRWEDYRADDQNVILTGEKVNRVEKVTTLKKAIFAHTTKVIWKEEGKVAGVLGFIHDVTELIEAEKAKEKAECESKLKSDFIENMQHDFRTPVLGVCQGLAELISQETDPEKKAQLSLIYQSSQQLNNLCLEITDIDNVKQHENRVNHSLFDLKKLMLSVIELNQTAARQKGLALNLNIDDTIPAFVKSDHYRVKRILVNLIANAIKFTETGKISLKATFAKNQDKQSVIHFEITDTGIGIPEDKKSFIHNKTEQKIKPERGLGLRLVKQFVHDLNGDIEVQSESNQGTTFFITLPIDIPENETGIDEQDPLISLDNKTEDNSSKQMKSFQLSTLLIEDDLLARLGAENKLENLGCSVMTVDSVATAISAIEKQTFDLIISDVHLPDGKGFDIVNHLNAESQNINHQTPIFALTAHNSQKKLDELEKAGFTAAFTKPLEINRIEALLEQHVRRTSKPI